MNAPTERDTIAAAIAILWDGYYGETHLRSVNGVGTRFADDSAGAKRIVLEATRWLLDRDLVRLHSIDRTRLPADIEIPWTGSAPEQIARLDSVYTNEAADYRSWAYACWFVNTEAGDALAEANPPEPWTDDDDD